MGLYIMSLVRFIEIEPTGRKQLASKGFTKNDMKKKSVFHVFFKHEILKYDQVLS